MGNKTYRTLFDNFPRVADSCVFVVFLSFRPKSLSFELPHRLSGRATVFSVKKHIRRSQCYYQEIEVPGQEQGRGLEISNLKSVLHHNVRTSHNVTSKCHRFNDAA